MLVIRKEQIRAFAQAARLAFEKDAAVHLRSFSPHHCVMIGEKNLRRVIHLGIARAAEYGFTCFGPVRFYLEMMFLLGSGFDTDPQTPVWMGEILRSRDMGDELDRADCIYERSLDYFAKVAGPDNVHAIAAQRNVAEMIQRLPQYTVQTLPQQLIYQMEVAYPQKCLYLGEAVLQRLIREGVDTATALGMREERSLALFCILMFTFGHHFADDPLYPWAWRILKDAEIVHPDDRAARLHAAALQHFEQLLKYLT